MPYIVVEKPKIVTISYRQTESDKDYGSCLWARFNFDQKNYSLSIESDCGNFSNAWYPTPDRESFLHLCSRFDSQYLLDKISSRSVIDAKATLKTLMTFLQEYNEEAYEGLDEVDFEDLNTACHSYLGEYYTLEAINSVLEDTKFAGKYSEFDIASCIEKDYPSGVKRIVDIYRDYIQPVVRQLAKEDA